jgi:hypothetical protein
MAVNLSPYGGVGAQFLDNAGNVLTGGKIETYAAGTTTPQAVYTTSAGNVFHSNPIILDASGRVPSGGEIWLTDGLSYKFVLKDSNDVLIATYDNISGINSNFIAFTNQQEIQIATAGQTVFNLTTTTYQPGTNSLSVFVDGVNQYGPGAQYAYLETDSDTVTFVTGLHVGAEVKFTTSQLNSSGLQANAFQVSYTPPFTNSVGTNVGNKLAQTVSVKDFGAVGDGVTNDTVAIQNAIDTESEVYFPEGTYLISATLSITYQGAKLYGSGITGSKSTLKRATDSNFGPLINVAVGAEGFILTDLKIVEQDLTYTNTSPLVTIRANDFTVQRCWFWYGYRQLNLTQGASNATIIGNTFETARKQAIYTYSSALLKIIGNTFWKCTADFSNPADRSQVIGLFKDPTYTNGTWDVNITGNYFYEAVYGNFIEMDGSEGIQITGNFFTIPSQVDNGQRDDINIKNSVRIAITGNTSNAVLNSYAAGQRGARYCVNLVSGNSQVSITGNTLLQGVSGTINDPSNVAVIMANACTEAVPDISKQGLKLPNVTKATNVLSWYEEAAWTPYLNFGGARVGQTYSLQLGTFTRVGRLVTLSCSIALSNKGSSTGAATISGFPYQSNATPTAYIIYAEGGVTLTGQLAMANGGNSLAFSLLQSNNGSVTPLTDAAFTTPTIRFCIQYESV